MLYFVDAKYKEYKRLKLKLVGGTEDEEVDRHKPDHSHSHHHHHHREHKQETIADSHVRTTAKKHHHHHHHHSKTTTKLSTTITPVKQTREYDAPYAGNSASSSDSARRQRKIVTQVGPTPLAEGKALAFFSIFDLNKSPIMPIVGPQPNASRRLYDEKEDEEDEEEDENTPDTPTKSSSIKRRYSSIRVIPETPSRNLPSPSSSLLSTPPSQRRIVQTPSSVSYFQRSHHSRDLLSTPSPLKRPKPVVRGLSAILAELRKAQDETYTEEEQILREMEMEERQQLTQAPPTASAAGSQSKELAENNTFHLGEFQEGDIDEMVKIANEREAAREKHDKYKKAKTQKRTTRLVKSACYIFFVQ